MLHIPFLLTLLLWAFSSAQARAQGPYYSLGHGDVRLTYLNGQLLQDYRLDPGSRVAGEPAFAYEGHPTYSTSDLVVFIPNLTLPRPAGAEWDFLGNSEGEPLWYIPEVQEPDRPWLGTSSESLDPSDWNSIKVRLISVTGPAGGHFSFFDSGLFDGAAPKFTTADGISDADEFSTNVGSHAHFNWMFTKPGRYAITLQTTGEHKTDGTKTSAATFTFQVGEAPPSMLVQTGSTLSLDIGEVEVRNIGPADTDDALYHRTAFRMKFAGSGISPSNDSGIVVQEFGTHYLRAREGSPLLGDPQVRFSSFGDPVIDNQGNAFFCANLAGSVNPSDDEVLVRVDSNNSIAVVAREGSPAPGLDGFHFGKVTWYIAAPNGVLTFAARATKGKLSHTGVWRSIHGGEPSLLIATGQVFPGNGKLVTLISSPTSSANARNQSRATSMNGLLTLRLSFRGGSHGLVVFPSPLP